MASTCADKAFHVDATVFSGAETFDINIMAELKASSDVDAVDNVMLDTMNTPALQPVLAPANGFSTPQGPFLLDFLPTIAPSVPTDFIPRRVRTFSELTRQSIASLDWIEQDQPLGSCEYWTFPLSYKEEDRSSISASFSLNNGDDDCIMNKKTKNSLNARRESTRSTKSCNKVMKTSPPRGKQSTPPSSVKKSTSTSASPKRNGGDTPSGCKQNTTPRTVSPGVTLGPLGLPIAYNKETRCQKIQHYLEKRKRRVWRKEIKYSCRKQFAESRPRVAGRFVPKSVIAGAQGIYAKPNALAKSISQPYRAPTPIAIANDDLLCNF